MENKNVATRLLEKLGVFALMQSRLTIEAPKKVVKKKIYLTSAQKERIAGLRLEQKHLENELKRLKELTKGKIKTINNEPKQKFFDNLEQEIRLAKGTISSIRG